MDNPHGGYVIHRHMKPSPGFTQSLWATQKPGDEAATLGEYYPVPAYQARATFEALGCPVKP